MAGQRYCVLLAQPASQINLAATRRTKGNRCGLRKVEVFSTTWTSCRCRALWGHLSGFDFLLALSDELLAGFDSAGLLSEDLDSADLLSPELLEESAAALFL